MIEGSSVKLHMKKVLKTGMILDKSVYTCNVDSYDEEVDKLVLIDDELKLEKLSLDAIYDCEIYQDKMMLQCEGQVKERYQGEDGNLVVFYIQNGFYEKSID